MVPRSVGCTIDTTAGCEWWASPHRVVAKASSTAAGVRRPCSSPGSARVTALVNSDVEPHSLTTLWAVSWHSTDPHGGHKAESPRALAAVPDTTGNTAT